MSTSMNNPDQLNRKGVEYGQKRDTKNAIKYFQLTLKADPTHIVALTNLAYAYRNLGKFQEAIITYEKALIIDPMRAKTHSDLGNVYYDLGEFEEAKNYYNLAIKYDGKNADYHSNLGTTLADLKEYEEAVKHLKIAVKLNPQLAEAYYNLGYIFQNSSSFKEAIYFYNEALRRKSDMEIIYPHLYFMLRHICDWKLDKAFNKKLDDLYTKSLPSNEVFDETPFISFVRSEDPEINFEIAKRWSQKYKSQETKKEIQTLNHQPLSINHSRIRIGYVSDAFYDFPTAHNITNVLKNHDKNKFEIFVYSHGPDDKSFYRKEIKKAVYKFRDIRKLNDQQAADLIKRDKIDILIDLKGHMRGSRLSIFARKPALLQASWIGYPATTGADYIDYIIADKVVIPKSSQKYYSEKVLYLPNCYRTPDTITPVSLRGAKRRGNLLRDRRAIARNDQFIFSSFNSPYKITSEVFNVWCNILKRVPNSVLWILVKNDLAQKNLLEEAKARDISEDRIVFADKLPKDEHLARISLADLALDTHPVNGHTTTTDCLRVNVPVVSMLGKHFASRVSASCLFAIDMPELVTKNLKDYENLAVKLADSKKIQILKNKIQTNKSKTSLFNIKKFTKDLESIYIKMYNNVA